jgi:hypothetical protein
MKRYTALFEEVRVLLAAHFEPGGSLAETIIEIDEEPGGYHRERIRIRPRDAAEKHAYATMLGEKGYQDRVDMQSRAWQRAKLFKKLRPATRLADAFRVAALDGIAYSNARRVIVAENKRLLAIASRLLTEAGIPHANTIDPHTSGEVKPRVYIGPPEPLSPGRITMERNTRDKIYCWPEHAVEGARALLALSDATAAFEDARQRLAHAIRPGDST